MFSTAIFYLLPFLLGFGLWLLLVDNDVHGEVSKKVDKYKTKLNEEKKENE